MFDTNKIEVHTEELQLNGLIIKFFISLNQDTKNYHVVCKAFDRNKSMLWCTELLDSNGKPLTFYSLPTAVSKTRSTFSVYKKHDIAPV